MTESEPDARASTCPLRFLFLPCATSIPFTREGSWGRRAPAGVGTWCPKARYPHRKPGHLPHLQVWEFALSSILAQSPRDCFVLSFTFFLILECPLCGAPREADRVHASVSLPRWRSAGRVRAFCTCGSVASSWPCRSWSLLSLLWVFTAGGDTRLSPQVPSTASGSRGSWKVGV